MGVLLRSTGPFFYSILLLAFMQGAIVSHLSISVVANNVQVDLIVELHRSLVRYRHLLGQDESRRALLQTDEKQSGQREENQNLIVEKPGNDAVTKLENHVEETVQGVKEAVVPVQSGAKGDRFPTREIQHDNQTSEKIDSEYQNQQRDSQAKVGKLQNSEEQQEREEKKLEPMLQKEQEKDVEGFMPEPKCGEQRGSEEKGGESPPDYKIEVPQERSEQRKVEDFDFKDKEQPGQELNEKKIEESETKGEEQQQQREGNPIKIEQSEIKSEERQQEAKERKLEHSGIKSVEQQHELKETKIEIDESDIKSKEQQQESKETKIEGSVIRSEEQQQEEQGNKADGSESTTNHDHEHQQQGEERNGSEGAKTEDSEKKEEPFVFPEPYLLGPTIKDWDEQRGAWLDANPHMKTAPNEKPRVLIVTGSQPNPCHSSIGDHFHIKSLKLKIDYARMHNYEIYYNFAWLDPLFGSYWVKLPTVRKLMLTHPEIEWFFWVDSDAMFTDMLFEAPFHTYEGYNMIMWGFEYGFWTRKSWTGFNAGVFILRNCQWSLDLIDKWSPMGPDGPVREQYGKILSASLSDRSENYAADDQSALAYLIFTDEIVKSKVKLVEITEYMISGWWVQVVDTYENCIEKYHPGLGDTRWPWITHFTGCSPCNGDQNAEYEKCMANMERAFNFADNQVLAYMGFQHESLSSPSVIRTRNETARPLEFLDVNPWEERIAQVAAAAVAQAQVP